MNGEMIDDIITKIFIRPFSSRDAKYVPANITDTKRPQNHADLAVYISNRTAKIIASIKASSGNHTHLLSGSKVQSI